MKGVGIVVEYNPFHNGHKYHCDKAREYGDIVVAVMSGNFVQRGEPAIVNKWERTKMALSSGVDIIVELPVFYLTQSAEIFSRGAVGILNELKVCKLVFGSETGDVESLEKIAKLEENKEFQESLKKYLKDGNSYPTAYSLALKNLGEEDSLNSNDILGVEYIKGIKFWKSSIEPVAIKREKSGYYTHECIDGISSATGIRKRLEESSCFKDVVPEVTYKILTESILNGNTVKLEMFYELIRYRILLERENLENIQDVEDGFSNRLYSSALKNREYIDFFNDISTKRYTLGRIQRILIHILLNITKDITKEVKVKVPYIRVLGFTQRGREYLKQLKKEDESIKVLTSLKNIKKILTDKEKELLELNEVSDRIYSILNFYEDEKIPVMIK